jgi:hypothetical protein
VPPLLIRLPVAQLLGAHLILVHATLLITPTRQLARPILVAAGLIRRVLANILLHVLDLILIHVLGLFSHHVMVLMMARMVHVLEHLILGHAAAGILDIAVVPHLVLDYQIVAHAMLNLGARGYQD